MECTVANKELVPLSSAVKAAIVDKYGDIGKSETRYSHWGCRELKNIYMQALPRIPHKVLLTVNTNTYTATLPLDFSIESFIGGINSKWNKVPLKLNNMLVDSKNVTEIECEDKCEKCHQDSSICNDLVVTEDVSLIVINDTTYEKTVIKKLYPNGDYFLETTTPYLDLTDDTVSYNTVKDFIVNFDLKPCGCLDTTPANIVTLQTYCPDVYCSHYAPCETQCYSGGAGYKIFKESGLIQFDRNFPFTKVYMEYYGFIQKINGQYYVPQVAFETIVEGIKYRAIKDKDNEPRWRIKDKEEEYGKVKGNMMKILGRASLTNIVRAIAMLPKFDIDYNTDYYGYQSCFSAAAAAETIAACVSTGTGSGSSTTTIIGRGSYVLAVMTGDGAGHPVDGSSTYQNNVLRNATDVEYIFLAKQFLSKKNGDFTFDSVEGQISINPNVFITGDSLIINYNKNT